ncbi:SAF domain-containing protein [Microlunatus capsulatus]|uniref:Flp pilus assembly protein CpaB n=1 Tax=Microlunatus capsulatus TaxID=99117 RepID=A0ABS4ZAF0_9ACTN|nr:SAF domain-containing protein [Microlunatus capsulatus]MBP2418030.1 Flp pilus assembly protein CpaB [Microlunatus capsulatus]
MTTSVRSRRRPGAPAGRRHPLRSLLRAASWHRRPLAAVAAALAVLTGVSAALPEGPPERTVLVAVREVPGGSVLAAADVEPRALRSDDLPAAALDASAAVVGRAVSAPLARGQVLTPLALVAPRAGPSSARVVTPVRLADAGVVALLRPGDVVDLVGTDEQDGTADVVAPAARVVTIPQIEEEAAPGSAGGLVLVEVPPGTGTRLARAAARGPLTVLWR